MSVNEPVYKNIHFHVAKGDRVLLWLGTWIRDIPVATQFPDLFAALKIVQC